MSAIKTAKTPLGKRPVDLAWERSQAEPLPEVAKHFDGDSVAVPLLGLCYQLHKAARGQPCYLAGRVAAKLLGTSHTCCAKLLSGFVALKILEVVDCRTTHKARTYRWKGS